MIHAPSVLLLEPSCDDAELFHAAVLDVIPDIHVEVVSSLGGLMSCLLGVGHARAFAGELPDLLVIGGSALSLSEDAVMREIRKSPRWKTIPMAVIADCEDPGMEKTVNELGVIMFMRKPSDMAGYQRLARMLDGYFFSVNVTRIMTPPS